MIVKVSVLGCGWLGLPLAKELSVNFKVKGSTTTKEKIDVLKSLSIESFLIKLNPKLEGSSINNFLDCDLLIVNIPPGLRTKSPDYYIQQMQSLRQHLMKSSVKYLIYISSTSVYPDLNREVKEEDVLTEKQAENKTLFIAEEIFRKDDKFAATIVRCAGLAGYDRNLVRHFAGKENLKMGNAPINLIHRDDVLGIIHLIIQKGYWNQTINICAPEHPLRKDFYPAMAQKYNYPLMTYNLSDHSDYKVISIGKLQNDLNYRFKYPDPADFLYS